MKSSRKTSIIVGLLFIIATVTAILTIAFLGKTLETPLNFGTVSENEFQVVIAVLLWIILAISVAGIGFMMYPILRKYHEGLALGYIGFRITESICIIISSVALLSILTISHNYISGIIETANYQPLSETPNPND